MPRGNIAAQNTGDKQLERKKIFFYSWFQGFQSMFICPCLFGPKAGLKTVARKFILWRIGSREEDRQRGREGGEISPFQADASCLETHIYTQ